MNIEILKITDSIAPLFDSGVVPSRIHKGWTLTGYYKTKARDRNAEIDVFHWFADFWLYCEILTEPFNHLGISVFQGSEDDDVKTPLFRAEWYEETENEIHPQPHWHVYSYEQPAKANETFQQFLESTGLVKSKEFKEYADSKDKIVNLKKFHFAMYGQWDLNEGGHIHVLKDGVALQNWLYGVLKHIREQLEYIMK